MIGSIWGMRGGPGIPSFVPLTETWDYTDAMREVAARFTGTEGKVEHFADSISFGAGYGAWALGGAGKTQAQIDLLEWMHANDADHSLDGWYLAKTTIADEFTGLHSRTATNNIVLSQVLAGGYRNNIAFETLIAEDQPQIGVFMCVTNDARDTADMDLYEEELETVADIMMDAGCIPVLSTGPPWADFAAEVVAVNARVRAVAERNSLPLIDFYGEITRRRSGTSWDGTLISPTDHVHPSIGVNGATTTSAPTAYNLRNCGDLLRGWLSVEKIAEVKARVLS